MFNSMEELLNNFRLQKHLFTHKEDQVGNNKTHKQEGRHSFQETDFFTELNRMESKIWVYFTVQRIGVCLWYVIWNSYFSNSPGIKVLSLHYSNETKWRVVCEAGTVSAAFLFASLCPLFQLTSSDLAFRSPQSLGRQAGRQASWLTNWLFYDFSLTSPLCLLFICPSS